MVERELIGAALRWYTMHLRRLAAGKEKRRIDAQLRAGGDGAWCLQRVIQQNDTGRQLTELKRKELAALRELARLCPKQRGHLQAADVIDVNGTAALLAEPGKKAVAILG
ncbi:hypothetical protein [Duganella callida]|uniref:Uncharacterized protein n=1 Tax=Duganella callida TaxID=2561932 RepID=A0A4Y9RZW2_9BURK|nr:hypothetical protein [Duganella callida]TFW13285.1 hypothetical protein E4L98_29225 [Duganella callida]